MSHRIQAFRRAMPILASRKEASRGRPGTSHAFEIQIDKREGTTFVRLTGELDMATAPALQEALHAAQHAETSHVIVDLRQLTFLDSFGLRILAAADIAGRDGHVKVSFISGSDSVHRVFEITEMGKRVDWTDAPE